MPPKIDVKYRNILVQREPFDYSQWRKDVEEDKTVRELSSAAMRYVHKRTPVNAKKYRRKRTMEGIR
jgi:hypothetical protein